MENTESVVGYHRKWLLEYTHVPMRVVNQNEIARKEPLLPSLDFAVTPSVPFAFNYRCYFIFRMTKHTDHSLGLKKFNQCLVSRVQHSDTSSCV